MTGDPWDGRTLEWTTSSPAPAYNFAHIPVVSEIDAFWHKKQNELNKTNKSKKENLPYLDIHMPKNTSAGFVISIFAFIFSFAMVWHIWWLALFGLGSVIIAVIMRSFNYDTDYYIAASDVKATEMKYQQSIVGRS